MEGRSDNPPSWSWQSGSARFSIDKIIHQMTKAERSEKLEGLRTSNSQSTVADSQPLPKNGQARDAPEADSRELNGNSSKHKSINFSIQDALFLKHSLTTLFKKILLKINPEKKIFVLEFDPATEKTPNISHAKLEIRFADTVALTMVKETDTLELEFRAVQALAENAKKKPPTWTQTTIADLLQRDDLKSLPEQISLSVKLQKNDMLKIQNQKAKILDICKAQGLVVREGNPPRSKTSSVRLPFEEIESEARINELKEGEQNIMNWTKANRMEALQKIKMLKLPASLQKKKFCPVYQCFQEFGSVAQLRTHISAEHKVLETWDQH